MPAATIERLNHVFGSLPHEKSIPSCLYGVQLRCEEGKRFLLFSEKFTDLSSVAELNNGRRILSFALGTTIPVDHELQPPQCLTNGDWNDLVAVRNAGWCSTAGRYLAEYQLGAKFVLSDGREALLVTCADPAGSVFLFLRSDGGGLVRWFKL
jgi:hypothetical protein